MTKFSIMNLNRQFKKYVSLSVGILGWFLGGIIFGFNAYAIALKQTFNFTQTELEYIASSGDIGQCLSFPAGVVFDNFGPRVMCTISLILTTMGFTLMWLATNFQVFFSSKSWLLCVFYFMASQGTIFIIIASMVVNCKNFDRKHMGKVLGLLNAIFGISPAIFSTLYEGFFVNGHIKDAENQKLGEFMIMLAILSACINIFAVVTLKTNPNEYAEIVPSGQTETQDKIDLHNSPMKGNEKNERTELEEKLTKRPQLELNCWQIIKTSQFYYIFFICIIIGGIGGTFTNNITTVVKSADTDIDSLTFTVSIPLCASIGRLFGGAIPDYIFLNWPGIPKSSILLFSGILTCISQEVFIFFNQSLTGLICGSLTSALAYGAFYVQISIIVISFFGLQYCGQNNGLIVLGHAVGIVSFQQLFAFNYETYSLPGSKDCYGDLCTRKFFIMTAVLSSCAVFLICCLVKIERDQNKELQEPNK